MNRKRLFILPERSRLLRPRGVMAMVALLTLATGSDAQVQSFQGITTGLGGFSAQLGFDDGFGADSVALGDVNSDGRPDFAVTAYRLNSTVTPSLPTGAIFILSLNPDGTVFSETMITAAQVGFSATGSNGQVQMGQSIEAIGDLNNDGVVDLLVGAHWYDSPPLGGLPEGSAAILFLNASLGLASSQIIAEGVGGFTGSLDTDDSFGIGVASLGDVNGDGIVDVAVGAQRDDEGGPNRGAVYVLFLNVDGTVASHQKISTHSGSIPPGTLNHADFFAYPAGLGDLDGDGVPDMAVGAPGDDIGGLNRGSVHILFLNSDGTVKNQTRISHAIGGLGPVLQDGDFFGYPKSQPDIDGDGVRELTVGAPGADRNGASYVLFLKRNGSVRAHVKIEAHTLGLPGLSFGHAAGFQTRIVDDINGDGNPDMLFGSHRNHAAGPDGGAVFVLFLDPLSPFHYAGTEEDFVLSTGVNSMPCTTGPGEGTKTATAFDTLSLCLTTPGSTLLGAPIVVVAEGRMSGTLLTPSPALSHLWVHPCVLIDGLGATAGPVGSSHLLTPNGPTYGFQVPGGLAGFQIAFQAAAFSSLAGNGSFALSDAHIIQFQ